MLTFRRPAPGISVRRPVRVRAGRRALLAGTLLFLTVGSAQSVALPQRALAAGLCTPPVVNPVACENTLAGDPATDWQVAGAGDASIQGFATDISVNAGSTVNFKISSGAPYHIDILRIGYYQGNGARKVAAGVLPSAAFPQTQPACLSDAATGLTDCGNWAVSGSWAVPGGATSGVYMAHLVRNDGGGGSLIPFIVRNDASTSDLLFQTSDSTWQAYNRYGGNDFYTGSPAPPVFGLGRSYAVSYNRPIITGDCCEEDWFFHAEYPTVRYLEQNGYNVSYSTDVDSDRNGALIKQHRVLVTAGHDEYWSASQRANVTAARDGGVSLMFLSGNNVYWKTRLGPSLDAGSTASRTIYCYKETWAGAPIDPKDPSTWTGTWRDPRFSPPADGGQPENALTGSIFMVNQGTLTIQVPFQYAGLRLWRNTAVSQLQPGQTASLAPNSLGYEWNQDLDNGFRPAGLFDLSSTTGAVPQALLDYGQTVGPATATHSLTEYRAPSGALVFSAGTIQWAWGLDDNHTGDTSGSTDASMQQATINLLADMGAQPATLIPGMVAATRSADATPPTSVITAPAVGSAARTNTPVTVSGTAGDSGGGVVAGVEVSTDGGATWHPATGTTSWVYTWTPAAATTVVIRSRAVDDSGNLESPSSGRAVVASTTCPCSLWTDLAIPDTPTVSDSSSTEVGLRFRTTQAGFINGIRFYKGSGNTGTHVGTLWSALGVNLASVSFSAETSSGWQTASFASPVAVTAGTNYIASYLAPNGGYSSSLEYFCTRGVSAGPLQAPSDGTNPGCGPQTNGPAGLYTYSGGVTLPASTYESTNYWVDVVFTTAIGPSVTSTSPPAGATGVAVGATATATFNTAIAPASLAFRLVDRNGGAVPATVSYDGATTTATLRPAAALAPGQAYTASVSATDTAGHPMASPSVWNFTTAGTTLCPCTIWPPGATPVVAAANDTGSVELGVKFTADTAGFVSGIRFYKGPGNTGTHIGNLWTAAGTLLATATFINETASGWQQVNLSSQVAVAAGTTYVASYFAPAGNYAADFNYFGTGHDNAPLHALSSPAAGGDGTYAYGSRSTFPNATFSATNYWVDVVFTTQPAAPPACPCSLFPAGSVPTPADSGDGSAVVLGVKVSSDSGGYLTAIRFYKAAANTGTHVVSLWSSSGQLLVSTPVTGESASGWQQQALPVPVAITAGTTYVASYLAPAGHYSAADGGFSSAVSAPPLHGPSSSSSGGNGVYIYGANAYPSNTYNSTNYWVDVVFSNQGSTVPPTVTAQSPAAGAAAVPAATNVSATFSQPVQASSLSLSLKSSGGVAIAGSVAYDVASQRATFTPSSQLVYGTSYTATVNATGVSGIAMSQPSTWSFTTVATACPCSIFGSSVPAISDAADPGAVELGVKFTADVGGHVTGLRFYKSAANTGSHTGTLWTVTGQPLATATFTNETASGWQTLSFATPVAITAGTTYIASYFDPRGHYAATGAAFAAGGLDRPPLHALGTTTPGGDGVYVYNAVSAFPSSTWNASNYWVDVVFTTP